MHPGNRGRRAEGRAGRLGLLRAGLRALVLAMALHSAAMAAPISVVTVSGSGNAPLIIDSGEAAAVGFTLGQDYSDVAIGADLFCVACEGSIYLMRDLIGPLSDLVNFVTGTFFDVNSSVDPLLDGLDLTAGNYFLIVAITEGAVGWNGSDPIDVDTAAGSSIGLDFFADELASPEYRSDFGVILSAAGLHFSVRANEDDTGPIAVPAPPTLLLLLAGLTPILIRRASISSSSDRRA
jgi:hypothetical protein